MLVPALGGAALSALVTLPLVMFPNLNPLNQQTEPSKPTPQVAEEKTPEVAFSGSSLSESQKIAWKKKCQEHRKNGKSFQVVAYFFDGEWAAFAGAGAWIDSGRGNAPKKVDISKLLSPWRTLPEFPDDLSEQSARGAAGGAAEAISEGVVAVVVIIDLYSGEVPRAVRYYRDNGSSVKETANAPTREIASSLRTYLFRLQTSLVP